MYLSETVKTFTRIAIFFSYNIKNYSYSKINVNYKYFFSHNLIYNFEYSQLKKYSQKIH